MAREPIRWDNVAMPQFNNSALAVASGAFTSSANDAAKLAEALHQRELENQTKREQDALNLALGRLYADGKATPTDLQNLPAGTDMTALTQAFRDLGTYNAGLSESGARTRASNAATALSEAELENLPAMFKSEQALREAQRASALASADAARANLSRTQGLIGDEQFNRDELQRRIKGIDVVRNIVHGTGEGSLRGTFETSLWPTKRQEALAAAAEEANLPIDQLPAELVQQIDTEKRKGFLDEYVNAQLADPELKSRLIRESGLSEPEFEELTGYGQDLAAQEKSLLDLRTKLEEERQTRLADEKKWWDLTGAGDNSHVILNGAGEITMGEANTIAINDAKTVAARLGFDPDSPLVKEVREDFPHRQSFQNALMMVGVPQGGWFGDKTKFEFDDENAVRGRLQALRETRTKALTAAKQGPGEAPSGTPEENFITSVRAAASGLGGTTPEQAEAATTSPDLKTDIQQLKERLVSTKSDVQAVIQDLPAPLRTREFANELRSITEALQGKRLAPTRSEPVYDRRKSAFVPSAAEENLSRAEIDKRLKRWTAYQDVLSKRIESLKTSEQEKDALQEMFAELTK